VTTLESESNGKRGVRCIRRLLLAAAIIVPACTDGAPGTKNPGTTGALWNSTSGSGSPSDGGPGVLLWNDPNTAPIQGGTGGGGNLTYGQADPTDYGAGPPPTPGAPWMNSALSSATPQSATTAADEQTIEGLALAYQSSLINLGGAGGVAGIGGVGGIAGVGGLNQVAPLYSSQKMELEPRAYCEMELQPAGQVNAGPGAGAQAGLMWRLTECAINPAMQTPQCFPVQASSAITTANQAWNAMVTQGLQTRIQGITSSGYCGAGSWSVGGMTWWDLTIIDLPLGQTP
jgi:hypothetical protein